jgi:hypothetical protein
LAQTLASPCLGHKPKVKVGTTTFIPLSLAKTTSKTIVGMVSMVNMGRVKEGTRTTMEVDSIIAEVATEKLRWHLILMRLLPKLCILPPCPPLYKLKRVLKTFNQGMALELL